MTDTVYDSTKIRNALLASRLSANAAAYRVKMPVKTLLKIIDGNPTAGDVRVEQLARLADLLALPLASLFKGGSVATDDFETNPPPTPDDATTVIAVLYDRGTTPTINSDLANGLGWTLTRLQDAYRVANERLATVGLRLIRMHGEGSIAPIHDHTATRTAVEHAQADNTGLKYDAYLAAYQAFTGQDVLPDSKPARRRFNLGWLGNLGILDTGTPTPAITAAVKESFILD